MKVYWFSVLFLSQIFVINLIIPSELFFSSIIFIMLNYLLKSLSSFYTCFSHLSHCLLCTLVFITSLVIVVPLLDPSMRATTLAPSDILTSFDLLFFKFILLLYFILMFKHRQTCSFSWAKVASLYIFIYGYASHVLG